MDSLGVWPRYGSLGRRGEIAFHNKPPTIHKNKSRHDYGSDRADFPARKEKNTANFLTLLVE